MAAGKRLIGHHEQHYGFRRTLLRSEELTTFTSLMTRVT